MGWIYIYIYVSLTPPTTRAPLCGAKKFCMETLNTCAHKISGFILLSEKKLQVFKRVAKVLLWQFLASLFGGANVTNCSEGKTVQLIARTMTRDPSTREEINGYF